MNNDCRITSVQKKRWNLLTVFVGWQGLYIKEKKSIFIFIKTFNQHFRKEMTSWWNWATTPRITRTYIIKIIIHSSNSESSCPIYTVIQVIDSIFDVSTFRWVILCHYFKRLEEVINLYNYIKTVKINLVIFIVTAKRI